MEGVAPKTVGYSPIWFFINQYITFCTIKPIAECDDTHTMWFEHSVDLGKHLLWLLQILNTHAAYDCVKRIVPKSPSFWVFI